MALVKSVDRFDPDRGVEFSTFATRTVIGELKRHFRDKGWAIRAPRRIQELYLEFGPAVESLTQELGRPPTVVELADAIGASEEAVLEAMEAGQSYRDRVHRCPRPPGQLHRLPARTRWIPVLPAPMTGCSWPFRWPIYPNGSRPSSSCASWTDSPSRRSRRR